MSSGSNLGSCGALSISRESLHKHACASFLAGDTLIRVIPSFNYNAIQLISRSTVGPFIAGVDMMMPLWLGTMLRRKGLAKIVAPDWMDVAFLEQVLQFERDPTEASFSADLPHNHAEVARALLSACATASGVSGSCIDTYDLGVGEEIPNANKVKLLLEDISTVRMDKIRKNVHTLSNQTLCKAKPVPIINVTGIGSLEILAVRPFLQTAFKDQNMISKMPQSRTNKNLNDVKAQEEPDKNGSPERSNQQQRSSSRIRRFR